MKETKEKQILYSIRSLKLSYQGRRVLDVPEFHVYTHEVLAILGPNGAGKSTFLRVLALLEKGYEGELTFADKKIGCGTDLLSLRRRMALVFQEPLLYDLTVRKNVALGLKFRKIRRIETRAKVTCWLNRLDLDSLVSRRAGAISVGEARRVSLAQAFVLEPELLLLDEPFANLDPMNKERLLAELKRILPEAGSAVILVTQDREEALALADRIALMRDGKIVQAGTPEQVFSHPIDSDTASFLGSRTILSGKIDRHEGNLTIVKVNNQEIAVAAEQPVGEDVILCLRPEDITLWLDGTKLEKSSARNLIHGRITAIQPWERNYHVELDCGFPLIVSITRAALEELGLKTGDAISAQFKATAVQVVKR